MLSYISLFRIPYQNISYGACFLIGCYHILYICFLQKIISKYIFMVVAFWQVAFTGCRRGFSPSCRAVSQGFINVSNNRNHWISAKIKIIGAECRYESQTVLWLCFYRIGHVRKKSDISFGLDVMPNVLCGPATHRDRQGLMRDHRSFLCTHTTLNILCTQILSFNILDMVIWKNIKGQRTHIFGGGGF